jgi:putative ABC transport system substrate-binding protein
MKRITHLTLGAVLFALCVSAEAQQLGKIPRVGFLSAGDGKNPSVDAFRRGLRELGRVEGQNIAVEYRWGEGNEDRLPALAAELLQTNVDIIVVTSTPSALAAQQVTKTIPIIMTAVGNPVGSGLVKSLSQPGGNVTGLSFMATELVPKRLELLTETVPRLSRVAILATAPSSPVRETRLQSLRFVASSLGVELLILYVKEPDFESAFFSMVRERVGAFTLMTAVTPGGRNVRQMVDLAAKFRLPAVYHRNDFVQAGGLMSYAPDYSDLYRRAAYFVDKILKGAKPADLPVEQPTKFELVINLNTAKQLGLKIPDEVLRWADEIIK